MDVTLCNEASGDTLPMGSVIDHLGKLAHVKDEAAMLKSGRLSRQALENRKLLRQAMSAGGFKVLSTEWWHFNLKSRATARKYYKVIR